MKLRLRDDSLRLRLTRSEVAALASGQAVEARTRFAADSVLTYRVVASGDRITAAFASGVLTVQLPEAGVAQWCAGDELTLTGEHSWDGGALRIAVEKDLVCAKPREGEDNSDAFPASIGTVHCG